MIGRRERLGGPARLLCAVLALVVPAVAALWMIFMAGWPFYALLAAAVPGILTAGWIARHDAARRSALAAAVFCAAWCLAEILLVRSPSRVRHVCEDSPSGFRRAQHPGLGYAAWPNAWRRHEAWLGRQRLYCVTYHTDEHGWRVGPGAVPSNAPRALVFFGCSFTMGVGVEDDETLPALVESGSGGQIRCYNLGMDGYGPHQSLHQLEHNQVRPLLGSHAQVAGFHIAIPHHALRVAGRALWGMRGPRYEMGSDGIVHAKGAFHGRLLGAGISLLGRSQLVSRLHESWCRFRPADQALQAAVVARMAEEFQRAFGGPFHVLAWDTGDAAYPNMVAQLRQRGVQVIELTDLLPGYTPADPALLRPLDLHPTPACMQAVADALRARL
jgi:hypothetical protein